MTALLLPHLALATLGVTVVLAAALILRRAAGADAVLRYRVLLAAWPVCAAVLAAQVVAGEVRLRPATAALASGAVSSPVVVTGAVDEMQRLGPGSDSVLPVDAVARPFAPAMPSGWGTTLLVVYGAGVVVVLVAVAGRVRNARRVLRGCRPVTDAGQLRLWREVARAAGLRRPARLLVSPRLTAPACWALGRGAVILPAQSGERPGAVRWALHHEAIHLRRRDPLVALLQSGLCAVFWFHPLVWLYGRVLSIESEVSCDALVVRATGRPRSYALALLAYCERVRPAGAAPALAGFGSVVDMHRRVRMIEHAQHRVGRARVALVVTAATVTTLAALGGQAAATAIAGPPSLLAVATPVLAGAGPMRAEVHAPREGRSAADVYDNWSGYFRARGLSLSGRLTDQETILHAWRFELRDNVIESDTIGLNLPEGSQMRAEFSGAAVIIAPRREQATSISVEEGEARIIGPDGVVRMIARPARAGATLHFDTALENREVTFQLTATRDGRTVPVQVELDFERGLPRDEGDPPHGAVRYRLLTPDDPAEDPLRVKMQWFYDVDRLREEAAGGDAAP